MRQTLFFIPAELGGYPIFGFGITLFVFLALTFLAMIWRVVKTKKFDEDFWSYLGLAVISGVILGVVAPNVMEPEGFPVRSYGTCMLVAILAALGLLLFLGKKKGLAAEQLFSLSIWAVISGLLGARIFYVVQYHEHMIAHNSDGSLNLLPTLLNLVNLANGGLVVYGSIIGGIGGALVFIHRYKMPILRTFDVMAPTMMLGLAIGRIGCFLNGCCFGGVTDSWLGVIFPVNSQPHVHQIAHGLTSQAVVLPVHPTQLYSSANALALCLILLGLGQWSRLKNRDGAIFAAFLILYPITRFVLEIIRTDEGSFMGTGMTISQCVSVGVLVVGVVLILYITLFATPTATRQAAHPPQQKNP